MKTHYNRLLYAIVAVVAALVACLVIFLAVEVHFFVHQAHELVRLKEDYANYTLALRRMIAEHGANDYDQNGSKKKKLSESDDEFITVNRDFDHLMRSAIGYARKFRLNDAVRHLYKDLSWPAKGNGPARRPVNRLRKRRRTHVLALDSDVASIRAEHPLAYPLNRDSFHVSSRFGPRKRANGSWGFHYGLDMAAPHGTPVRAAAHGVVLEARFTKGFGNMVLISHSNKLQTRYAHLSKIDVSAGDCVEQGQRVGRVGNTGYTRGKNGVHLHFEVLVYGKQKNPLYFL